MNLHFLKRVFPLVFVVVLVGCTHSATDRAGGTSPSPTDQLSTPSPAPTPSPIPANWIRTTDQVAGYSMAHPADWTVSKATRLNGESSMSSFGPNELPDTGGVPATELKVAVVHFVPNATVQLADPAPGTVKQEQTMMIDGVEATRRVIDDRSYVVTVTFSRDGSEYQITAYPGDSRHIQVFDQMVQSFQFEPAVTITEPALQSVISSPIRIRGQAPGNWFFEGSLSARLETPNGTELGTARLEAEDDWMTEEAVPFAGTLEFTRPTGLQTAELVLMKANPSGLPENEREVRLTVQLQK